MPPATRAPTAWHNGNGTQGGQPGSPTGRSPASDEALSADRVTGRFLLPMGKGASVCLDSSATWNRFARQTRDPPLGHYRHSTKARPEVFLAIRFLNHVAQPVVYL